MTTDIKQFITVEPSLCPNVWDVWFNCERAYAAGCVKNRPLTKRESAFHIERTVDGKFVCDDDKFHSFDSLAAAEMFATAATISYHAGM